MPQVGQSLGLSYHTVDSYLDLGSGPRQSPDVQQLAYLYSKCMSCGCCLEACPQFVLEPDNEKWARSFVGAHATSQARLFNEHPTGAVLKGQRMDALAGIGGISDCGNAQNCVKVCPKEIPLPKHIATLTTNILKETILK
mgnify:CR=1 FL=1